MLEELRGHKVDGTREVSFFLVFSLRYIKKKEREENEINLDHFQR